MNWLHYLVEANIYLSVFYLVYCLFLHRETHYTLNRLYLLFSCVVSFIIPLIQIGILKPVESDVQNPVHTLVSVSHFTLQDGIVYSYFLGVIIFIILLVFKLYQLQKMARVKPVAVNDQYKLIYIDGSTTAFSFFNYLFIGTKAPEAAIIIRHELVHIRQKHSVDIILLELFKIINWFNPIVYLLQKSLKTIHEYIADEQTVANETDALTYSSFLVNNAYGISGTSITHSFFNYNLLKKRIIMLHQQRSSSLARLKYITALPLCAGLLCASTLGFSKTYSWIDIAPQHLQKGIILRISLNKQDTIKKKILVLDVVLTPPPVKNQVPPPPPPAPPKPPVKVTDHKVPPPPPPKPPVKAKKVKPHAAPVVKPDKP